MSNNNIGSTWKKWDLHIHSPESLVHNYEGETINDKWEKFISDLENLPREFKVIGINDYLFLDGYRKTLEYKKDGRLRNIDLILPVLEFRLKKFSGTRSLRRINFHVIFSNELNIDTIQSQFLNGLSSKYKLSTNLADNFWDGIITRESLSDLGRKIKSSIPPDRLSEYGSDLIEGFNNLNLDENDIIDKLKSSSSYFDNKYITAIGKTEWDSFQWNDSSIGEKKDIINKVDLIFTASESTDKYLAAKKILTEQQVNNLLLDCSDSHNNSDSSEKDRIGNCNNWIKSNSTFEGLRQVIFEPEYRLQINNNKPVEPILRIDKVSLNFPTETKIGNDSFCLIGENEIYFNPCLTCLIGGRGTGKSMILNLIDEKLRPGKNLFFHEYPLSIPESKDINDCVNIDNDDEKKYVEFLGQNQIEEFAKNQVKFTNAIYQRIKKRDESNNLIIKENELSESLNEINKIVEDINEHFSKVYTLSENKKELQTNKKLVSSFTSEEYVKIKDGIDKHEKDLNNLNNSKADYHQLRVVLDELDNGKKIKDSKNLFDERYNFILESIKKIIVEDSKIDLTSINENEQSLMKEIKSLKDNMQIYLSEQGFSEDNLKDLSEANTRINELEIENKNLEKDIDILQNIIQEFDIKIIENKKLEYEKELENLINPINNQLSNLNIQVKPISLKFEFNEVLAKEELYIEFRNTFDNYFVGKKYVKEEIIKDYLFEHDPLKLTDRDSLLKTVTHDSKELNQSEEILKSIFSIEKNFNIYKLLSQRTFLNSVKYKKISVSYDNKPIEISSFGQRCTATIVILLLLGNNPIIIDEPEAHLDGLLIAHYLVELIKSKKQHRQIIFATHNANLVVNGDAELIYILKIDDKKLTKITSTTIEDLQHREDLIALEGGREAFTKRENKYF